MILFGYFHSNCIYESAQALVSLHASKAGAWRAMHAARWAHEVDGREFQLLNGEIGKGWKPLRDQSFSVRVVTVMP